MPDIVIPKKEIEQRRRLRVGATLVGVGLLVAFLFAIWERVPEGPSVSVKDILLGTVKTGNLVVRIRAPGELRSRSERWATSPVAGTVVKVNVYPGSTVRPDSVLLTLTNPSLQTTVLKANAELAKTRARAATEMAHLKGEMLALRGHLGSATAGERALIMKVRAETVLYGEHVISRLQFLTDRLNASNAKIQVRFLRQRIAAFESDVAAEHEAESAAVAAARATLEQARFNKASLVLRAGVAGVVEVFQVHPGQALSAGTSVARIAGTQHLQAVLDVGPESAGELADGQHAEIVIEGNSRSVVPGHIVRISPNVVGGVVPVTVHLSAPLPAGVRPHLAVFGVVTVTAIPHAVYVERPVGVEPQTQARVFVVGAAGKRAIRASVQFGMASTQFIQVVSGLTPGQRVVVSETRHWPNAMRIR